MLSIMSGNLWAAITLELGYFTLPKMIAPGRERPEVAIINTEQV
jgi:hypothetical protein